MKIEMEQTSMVLSAHKIVKNYRRNKRNICVVNQVDFTAIPGKFTVIQGKSGSGKSTLLKLLFGLETADEGDVKIGDRQVNQFDDKELSRIRNTDIGYIPQEGDILWSLTVEENIRQPRELYGTQDTSQEVVQELLEKLDLQDLGNSYTDSLSGGERRRAAIARALANNPRIILADEPTNDLDTENTMRVIRLLKEKAQEGVAVVVVTHDNDVVSCADKIYQMENGCIKELELEVRKDG